MAISFNGNDGSSIVCGNLAGSPSTVTPAGQTDPIPVFFEWDTDVDHFDGIRINTLDYDL